MNSKIPLTVAVVGALLIGGATTGTTRASWSQQAPQSGTSVTAGHMSLGAVASPVSVSLDQGQTKTVVVTVSDTSAGKNLSQSVSATVLGAAPNVTAALVSSGTSCTADPMPTTTEPTDTRTLCLNVSAGASATAGPHSVTVNLSGDQVGGGWTSQQSVEVSVTVNQPVVTVPPAPTISCSPGRQNANSFRFSFSSSAPAPTAFTVYESASAGGTFTAITAPALPGSATGHTVGSFVDGVNRYFRVTVTNANGTSGFSKAIEVKRTGPGSNNFPCTELAS